MGQPVGTPACPCGLPGSLPQHGKHHDFLVFAHGPSAPSSGFPAFRTCSCSAFSPFGCSFPSQHTHLASPPPSLAALPDPALPCLSPSPRRHMSPGLASSRRAPRRAPWHAGLDDSAWLACRPHNHVHPAVRPNARVTDCPPARSPELISVGACSPIQAHNGAASPEGWSKYIYIYT